ncbi:MAG: ribonuclease J [Candidatus Saccharimonadales bacterium]
MMSDKEKMKKNILKITPLGGQNGIGEKNMIIVETERDAIVLDCGMELGLNIPGINYAVPNVEYLRSIRHKLRGYVISHGHLDHIGGLPHIVPTCPAPIFGSQFTIGMVRAQFDKTRGNFTPTFHVLQMDSHEQHHMGDFIIELIRVTHSVPESSAIVLETPAGRIINTGDFRLDPEPLDSMPSDIERLKRLGDEGVLLLMSESTYTNKPGRTPTEHTLQDSFYDLIGRTSGRIFVAVFSSNMNRVQMTINAAVKYGRKVALDGRSMMATAELAVRLGNLKIPKGTLILLKDASKVPDDELLIMCTGGQGEPGAAMTRLSRGEHKVLSLKKGDNVVISSSPIPGNEVSYQRLGDDVTRMGAKVYRHPTHDVDGCGPLHVSGHANRDEHREMIELVRPRFLMPIYGGALSREYHRDIGIQTGLKNDQIIMAHNGDIIVFDNKGEYAHEGTVNSGASLVDGNGKICR